MDQTQDDAKKKKLQRHPLDAANIINQLFFGWMYPYIWTGYRRNLELSDMPDEPPNNEKCDVISESLASHWNKELTLLEQNKKPSLTRATIKAFSWTIFTNSLISIFAEVICRTIQAYSVGQILHYIRERSILTSDESDSILLNLYTLDNPLVWWTLTLIITTICWVLTAHFYGFRMMLIGLHLRAGCSHLIYKKSLKLSQNSLGCSSIGQMVNLLSNDINKFNFFCILIPFLWIGPMQTVLSLYLIWPLIGPTIIGVVIVLSLLMPLQMFMSQKFGSYRGKIACSTDKRIRLVTEIISSLRLIKAYAWEYACRASMDRARKEETDLIFRVSQLKGFQKATAYISGKCIIFVTIVLHCVVYEQPLTPQILFISMAMLGNIQFTMTRLIPMLFSTSTEAYITLKRINDFLLLEERISSPVNLTYAPALTKFKPTIANDDTAARHVKSSTSVELSNVFARWSENTLDCALKNVSVQIKTGELTIVCGPVASGKSSLFLALLNELPIEKGQARVHGQISYASQEAWIFAGTVRDNIVFGSSYNRARYLEVVRVCALDRDLQLFESGDMTYINDNGVSLSGGQKARISLARTLYRQCDVYLLDDPLSAVDAHVQSHIFSEAIEGFLSDKTVILATHQLHYLSRANQIVVMKQGEIIVSGGYDEIKHNSKIDYLLKLEQRQDNKRNNSNDDSNNIDQSAPLEKIDEKNVDSKGEANEPSKQKNSPGFVGRREPQEESMSREFASVKIWWQYFTAASKWRFILLLVVFVLTQLIYSTIDIYLTVWTIIEQRRSDTRDSLELSATTKASVADSELDSDYTTVTNVELQLSTKINDEKQPDQLLQSMPVIYRPWYMFESTLNQTQLAVIYSGLMISLFAFAFFRNLWLYANNSRTAILLHRRLIDSALFAQIAFFDKNPIGRFLNRATSDIGLVDEELPFKALHSFELILLWFASVAMVALVDASLILPSAFVIILFIVVHQIYIKPARDIKRLENMAKSPILSHLTTSLNGLTTIRASKVDMDFERKFVLYQDRHTSVFLLFMGSNRWLAVILDWFNGLFISTVTVWAVITGLDGSSAGLVITNGILMCCMAQAGICSLSDLEAIMTSIERVSEYSQLPQEDNYETRVSDCNHIQRDNKCPSKLKQANKNKGIGSNDKPNDSIQSEILAKCPTVKEQHSPHGAANGHVNETKAIDMVDMHLKWPKSGSIEYRNVYLYYDDLERPVLNDLTFKINSGEKIGIVGRTGAGKSSILTTLFRLYDYQGHIFIDGIDSKTLGLRQLRSSISIIPQDPVLFTDTVRNNVDPFSDYDDQSVWRALELAHLKEAVLDMKHGLNSQLSGRGSNLSVGQRQLMCLARALLKQNYILVMDEATANVDPDTDEIIQKTVRKEFAQWTVIIIAHRLNTIIDCDKVVVMDAGKLIDMDEPYNLIMHKPKGLFARMLSSTGKSNEEGLQNLAARAHEVKTKKSQTY